MKRVLIVLYVSICTHLLLHATDYTFVTPDHPFRIYTRYRLVGSAEFYTHSVKHSHVNYADGEASFYFSHYLNPDNFLSWQAGYSYLQFDWDKNPRFSQDYFHYAIGSLAFVTTSWKQWRWILKGAVSVDAAEFNFGQSGVYYGMAWGRYAFRPHLGFHVGACGYTGIKNHYILPIVGIDWYISKKLELDAVFPLEIALKYSFYKHFCSALSLTSFGGPYRVPRRINHGGKGRYRNAIFEVFATGLELDLRYHYKLFCAGIGGGCNFGGWILIKDHNNHHGKYFKYNPAPYGQINAALTF